MWTALATGHMDMAIVKYITILAYYLPEHVGPS